MKVEIAGYNVDARVLSDAENAGILKEKLTPEVLSAAYARISRDPRAVSELRRIALEEVEKARKSNRTIIFEMGHHSVAEHAVFNFDIVGISRLAIESLERFRLCSYTEKSQRYITLDSDFVIPPEIAGTPYEADLMALVMKQTACYETLKNRLLERLAEEYPDVYKKKSGARLIDGLAKEDARYVTVLATTGQLGLTANARNLELIIRRFAASKLAEVRHLGQLLYEKASAVAPSLLLFTESSKCDANTVEELHALQTKILWPESAESENAGAVQLVNVTPEADRIVAAALLHLVSNRPFHTCRAAAKNLSKKELAAVFDAVMRNMEFFDVPPREFEHVSLTFEFILSASAFAQLKRHRMTTQSLQDYDPHLGVTVPPSVVSANMEETFRAQIGLAERLYEKLQTNIPDAAPYVLTNAHRRRVLMTTNLRELYHFIRLREDTHAQWDIRALAHEMRKQASDVMPLGTLLLCGKSNYLELYEKVFARKPEVIPPAAPFSGQIQY